MTRVRTETVDARDDLHGPGGETNRSVVMRDVML
jgi:hypothetical protein